MISPIASATILDIIYPSEREMEMTDWYERRDELEPGQIFKTINGEVVKLDHMVPGDGSAWRVADWWNGWSYMDTRIEPGDLQERLADNYSGDLK